MTPAVLKYVEEVLRSNVPTIWGDVLEVGSYNINGSVRPLFSNRMRFPGYLGVDMRSGPGVDRVLLASDLRVEDESFGVVVSTEMLEHDERFWVSLKEFHRVLWLGGVAIITTRGIGFPRHDYPSDYYRFTADGLAAAMHDAGFENVVAVEDEADQGVFATGWRIG